jgi:transposase
MSKTGTSTRYSPEVRDRAGRMVKEHGGAYAAEWAALTSIAEKFGCSAETLRKWVGKADRAASPEHAASEAAADRMTALERENRELRQANEILRKASAYFAQAELDRRSKP